MMDSHILQYIPVLHSLITLLLIIDDTVTSDTTHVSMIMTFNDTSYILYSLDKRTTPVYLLYLKVTV